jgi:hypothetical protein
MPGVPYFPGLPPEIRLDNLNQWSDAQLRQPISVPRPVQPAPFQPPAPHSPSMPPDQDPLTGTWLTSSGSWTFTKTPDGYDVVETSVFGQSGQGRATLQGGALSVDFTGMLGRMALTLTLHGGTLSGTMPVLGVGVPFVLRRA